MARPKIMIDPAEVEHLAKIGLNETQIAHALGCSPDTLRRRKQKSQAIQAALDRGKHRGIAGVAEALYLKAVGGDVRAMTLYLKARAGWHTFEQAATEENPSEERIVFYLPQKCKEECSNRA